LDDHHDSDPRRAYIKRFGDGWATFDADDESSSDGEEVPPIVARKPNDAREAVVRNFVDRWSRFHRAEDEEGDGLVGLLLYLLLRIGLPSAIAGCIWFVTRIPNGTQWIVFGTLSLLLSAVAIWDYLRSRRHNDDN
jgi:hypothetical protein